ncbi:MAG: 3-phosphoshikimate 1-carboxyvinyltransferase [Betaproteobacteria bacterium]|nr:3-phosphoshikimate 1-carboxyvinyltransferase [Betaproteobacteria bacterium]
MLTQQAQLNLEPSTHAEGEVVLPGSKSISNRTLLLAALSTGETQVTNLLKSDDTDVMLTALKKLGVLIEADERNRYRVVGCQGRFPQTEAALFLGNAGTAFRPLAAALAFQQGSYTLTGVPRMHERPIGDLVDALLPLGARIDYLANKGYPPLIIKPYQTCGQARVAVRGDVSSQFLSALLMALPLLGREVSVVVEGELISKPYVDITLNLMARFGVEGIRHDWHEFRIPAGAAYHAPGTLAVEGDASSASYFLAAGAIAGGPVRVQGVGRCSIQGDVRFTETLQQMGADITMGDDWIEARSSHQKLRAIDADLNHIPDAAMTVAILALFAEGTTTIRNIASWRVKETDRIAAMATELRKVGAEVEEGADYIRIKPPAKLTAGAEIDTYDDHRMAMCFSLVALGGVPITINNPGCVAKTFPDYFTVWASIASNSR